MAIQPLVEVGTVGGGTVSIPQQAILEILGLKGGHPQHPSHNVKELVQPTAAAVTSRELSLMGVLATRQVHRVHNKGPSDVIVLHLGGDISGVQSPFIFNYLDMIQFLEKTL